ncbi:hypothetical protein ADK53_08095, partial [Streptomyces sp. WM6373]
MMRGSVVVAALVFGRRFTDGVQGRWLVLESWLLAAVAPALWMRAFICDRSRLSRGCSSCRWPRTVRPADGLPAPAVKRR